MGTMETACGHHASALLPWVQKHLANPYLPPGALGWHEMWHPQAASLVMNVVCMFQLALLVVAYSSSGFLLCVMMLVGKSGQTRWFPGLIHCCTPLEGPRCLHSHGTLASQWTSQLPSTQSEGSTPRALRWGCKA